MRTIFLGGPGRSGTSFLAGRLGSHPQVCTWPDIELKIFTEKGGLLDLRHSLVDHYSPNRASVAFEQFRRMVEALIDGGFGQPALADVTDSALWRALFGTFQQSLLVAGHPSPMSFDAFHTHARRLLQDIATYCAHCSARAQSPAVFLEKTPHALLETPFLADLAPGAAFVHVMRDPRSIAHSLGNMRWAPDRADSRSAWVASYCQTFLNVQARAAALGIEVFCLRIEDLAAKPRDWAMTLCAQLGLDPVASLLDHASLDVLNGWVRTADAAELELLDDTLGGWAHHFGYLRDAVGTCQTYPTAA